MPARKPSGSVPSQLNSGLSMLTLLIQSKLAVPKGASFAW
jgi:hypothetical protein